MTYIFSALLVVVLVSLLLWVFVNSDAKSIARSFRYVIPVILLAFGVIATIAGQGQYGIPAFAVAAIWWYRMRGRA